MITPFFPCIWEDEFYYDALPPPTPAFIITEIGDNPIISETGDNLITE